MDLFAQNAAARRVGQPLAERMRPRSLAEFAGQEHLLGAGKLLGQLAAGRNIPSLLLWGPPGTGKTTLARLVAEAIRAHLVTLSAVDAGVKDVREAVTHGLPAGQVLPESVAEDDPSDPELRIAFDFDGVWADDASEKV